jgi:hypothetical protein
MADKDGAPHCSKCHKVEHVIRILYGRPGPKLLEDAQQGLAKLGGCTPKTEKFYCKECDRSF